LIGGDFVDEDPGIGGIWVRGVDGLEVITNDIRDIIFMFKGDDGIEDDGIIIEVDGEILGGATESSVNRFWDKRVIEINRLD